EWKGFATQKNSALEKAASEWVLSLDADEEVSEELAHSIRCIIGNTGADASYQIARRNLFLGRWIKHGGFYPDHKLRLWKRDTGRFQERSVHETAIVSSPADTLHGDLIHHAYPTLNSYIEHMNRYSSLGAELALHSGKSGRNIFSFLANVVLRPQLTFFYNYFLRLGFLDGREGLLLHLYHRTYVSWKYAKAWERASQGSPVK
ncbi:MAG: glycosyltransferase family 2 protein, partial [Acidobacteriaceae bacterium]